MRVLLVTCFLIAEVFFVLADQKVDSKSSEVKKLGDSKLDDVDLPLDARLPEAQRKRDHEYYSSRPNRYTSGGYHGYGRPGNRGRIVTRLQSQINRPFKHYGPPNQEGPSFGHDHNQPTSTEGVLNQDAPSPIRDSDFVEESPIASQNNQPFGQHTANYLPPNNQKLPAYTTPHLFSNQNHDFPGRHQQPQQQKHQQQFQELQQSQQLQQQQHQQQFHDLQQSQQLQVDNQNFLGQDFNAPSPNFAQNEFQNQQISDATMFLSQNAQAISDLYGAPASNQNYAPHNQEFEQIDQHQQQNQQNQQSANFQVSTVGQSQSFAGPLPSYASGVLNTQDTLEKIQSLEKDRIIAELQQALSNRETAARYNNFPQRENLQVVTSQFPPVARPSFSQQAPFLPTSTVSSTGYQGFYGPSTPATTTTTQPPVSSPTTTMTTTTHQPGHHGSSGSGTTQIGTSLPAPGGPRPPAVNPGFPQYGGFVPTFVSAGFLPSVPTYGTTLTIPTTALKPAESSPTHFGIPIPTFQAPKPAHQPPNTTPATTKPPGFNPAQPGGTPTFSIPLGPVHPFLHPPVVKPSPVPVIPAATPVHPTYGIHPTAVNPAFVYKPVKVFPVYYYPNVGYQYQSVHKPVAVAPIHPWSYAPSFAQTKPSQIWK